MGILKKINNLMPTWDSTVCTLWHPTMPSQSMGEWQAYLEFIDVYFRNRRIKKPLIVEIGIGFGNQKRFYEEVLGYDHIGIDILNHRQSAEVGAENVTKSHPDIVGDSKDPLTMTKLIEKLDGREVNLVYIDGGHSYEGVKKDYELYAPLAKNIIAIHDIVLKEQKEQTGRFWRELMAKAAKSKIQNKTFITLTGYYTLRHHTEYSFGQGTGLILLESMNKQLRVEGIMGEMKTRSGMKSMIWRVCGVVILAAITYAYTREWVTTGLITVIHHGVFLFVFYVHERAWLRVERIQSLIHRSLLKMLTYETLCGNVILGTITYTITGDWKQMTAITLTYIGIKHVCYVFNEFIWDRITVGTK